MAETLTVQPAAAPTTGCGLQPFFERLSRHADIDAAGRAALLAATSGPRRLDRGAYASREGDPTPLLTVICEGLVLCSRQLADGQQQNLAIRAPGQVLDQAGFVLGRASTSSSALTRTTIVSVARSVLSAVVEAHPALGEALTREMAGDVRVAQEWMVGMGRRSAYARVAHFFCEVCVRLEQAGMTELSGCPFPLTQGDLADTLGLSVVHTNRVLQRLRREGLIDLAGGWLQVRDWSGLVNAGGFDADYLQIPRRG